MERGERTPSDLSRPEGNDLESNYSKHDIGEAHVTSHLESMGLVVEEWGIDRRHDDGEDGLIYDDKMDLRAWADHVDGDLRGLVEVKVKTNDEWFGIINRRHFKKYLLHAHEHDVPTWVYMGLADEDESAIVEDAFIPIEEWGELAAFRQGLIEFYDTEEEFLDDQVDNHPIVDYTFRAPDGNLVVEFDSERFATWPEFAYSLGNA